MSLWAEVKVMCGGKGSWLRSEGEAQSQTEEAHLRGMLSRGRLTVTQVRKASRGEALSCPIVNPSAPKGTGFSSAAHVCIPCVVGPVHSASDYRDTKGVWTASSWWAKGGVSDQHRESSNQGLVHGLCKASLRALL